MRKIIILIVLIFSFIQSSSHADDIVKDKRMLSGGGYNSKLSLLLEDNCVYLEVEHSNTDTALIYIAPDNPIFMIRDPHGKSVRYIGPVAREPIQEINSVKKLSLGESYSVKILINKYYEVRQLGEYVATLNLDYYDPISHNSTYRGSVSLSFMNKGICTVKP